MAKGHHLTHEVMTRDRVRISMSLRHGPSGTGVVVICPGFFQSAQTPTFQQLADALADAQDILTLDFRGHGRSKGFYTFSAKETYDLEAVLDWARSRYRSIGLLGFSLGGAVAINMAGRRPGWVQSLVAVSAPCAFEEMELKFWVPRSLKTNMQGFERGAGCRPGNPLLGKERPIQSVGKLRQVSTLFVHGELDTIISPQHSRRLYEAAPEPKRLAIIPEGGHAEALFRETPRQFVQLINGWYAATLAQEGRTDGSE